MFRFLVGGTLFVSVLGYGGENLRINPKLNYSSDSQDGPLITGTDMDKGAVAGKPNYIVMFGEG
jgi:hypothetical protein